MQVYRGMDIGTAKPTPAEQAAVRHHLLDLADPAEPFSVAEWRAAADAALSAGDPVEYLRKLQEGRRLFDEARTAADASATGPATSAPAAAAGG